MRSAAHDDLPQTMRRLGEGARRAARALREADPATRTRALHAAAERLRDAAPAVLEANAADLSSAEAAGAAPAVLDRLRLDEAGVRALAASVSTVARLPDPVGAEMAAWTRPNGLEIARVRTPIGVIAVIYESRPNVTADAAALALRSGNAVILRGGSEALGSSLAIHSAIVAGVTEAGLPAEAVQMVATADRAAVGLLLSGLDGAVDLIVPRGGRSLLERVRAEARAPVLGHLEGLCHTFVHAAADAAMAREIVLNAKMRRVSVCGATETLLVDRAGAERLLPGIAAALSDRGCELRGDEEARRLAPMRQATEEDWRTEYLAPVLAVRLVDGVEGAIQHVAAYGSGHTDAIVTSDEAAARRFIQGVDSAIVLWNASTQFADGGEFGFGAEIGIATDKLHARGPVGAEQLTTFKYVVRGSGQTRP